MRIFRKQFVWVAYHGGRFLSRAGIKLSAAGVVSAAVMVSAADMVPAAGVVSAADMLSAAGMAPAAGNIGYYLVKRRLT